MTAPSPRLRIILGKAIAIGPGKAELLRLIEETGSISAAARKMGIAGDGGLCVERECTERCGGHKASTRDRYTCSLRAVAVQTVSSAASVTHAPTPS